MALYAAFLKIACIFNFIELSITYNVIKEVLQQKWSSDASWDQHFPKPSHEISIGHVNIGIVFLFIGNSLWCLYNTQSNLIGCSILSQEYCKLIDWCWKNMRRQLWTLTCPIIHVWEKADHQSLVTWSPDHQSLALTNFNWMNKKLKIITSLTKMWLTFIEGGDGHISDSFLRDIQCWVRWVRDIYCGSEDSCSTHE